MLLLLFCGEKKYFVNKIEDLFFRYRYILLITKNKSFIF